MNDSNNTNQLIDSVENIIKRHSIFLKCQYIYFDRFIIPKDTAENVKKSHKLTNLEDVYFTSDVHGYGKESFLLTSKGISLTSSGSKYFIEWQLIDNAENVGGLQINFDKENKRYFHTTLWDSVFDSGDYKNNKDIKYALVSLINELIILYKSSNSQDVDMFLRKARCFHLNCFHGWDLSYLKDKSEFLLKKEDYESVLKLSERLWEYYESYNDKAEIRDIYIKMKYIEGQACEKLHNNIKAYKSYINSYETMSDQYINDNDKTIYKDELKNRIYKVSKEVNENLFDYSVEERKVIAVTKDLPLTSTDTCIVTQGSNFKDISFLPFFEKNKDSVYVLHPLRDNVYIDINYYDNLIIEEKQKELLKLIECLGAKKVKLEERVTNKHRTKQHTKNEVGVEAKYGPSKVSGSGSEEEKIDITKNTDKIFHNYQEFPPGAKPYIPDGLIWYDYEPRWEDIAKRRLNGGIKKDKREIILKASDYFSRQEKSKLKAELSLGVFKAKGFFSSEEENSIDTDVISIFNIDIIYYPEEMLGHTIAKSVITEYSEVENKPKQKNIFARFIDFIKSLFHNN